MRALLKHTGTRIGTVIEGVTDAELGDGTKAKILRTGTERRNDTFIVVASTSREDYKYFY